METLAFILCVIPVAISITVSPNGNSPEVKMIGGMMVDIQKGFTPMKALESKKVTKTNIEANKKPAINSTNLSVNERYRRLIPYMTFYYANDLAPTSPTTDAYKSKMVEVEKAEIVEAKELEQSIQRDPKKIYYSPQRTIPRYEGNRLQQFNIASTNPSKVYYKEVVPTYQQAPRVPLNYNQYEQNVFGNREFGRYVQKQIVKAPSVPFTLTTRKPYVNKVYNIENFENVRYYYPEKQQAPKYKLVPYEQTAPVRVVPQPEIIYETQTPVPVPVLVPSEQIYARPRPVRPQYVDEEVQQLISKKKPTIVSEHYYEKPRPMMVQQSSQQHVIQPLIEGGFRPIYSSRYVTTAPSVYKSPAPTYTTAAPVYTTEATPSTTPRTIVEEPEQVQYVETATPAPPEISHFGPNYFEYEVERESYKPAPYSPPPKTATLTDLLNSLQLNKSVPKPITRENVGSSIMTLLQVLNALKAMNNPPEVEVPLSTPKSFIAQPEEVVPSEISTLDVTPSPVPIDDVDEPYLAPINTPSQHLDDFPPPPPHGVMSSQRFPQIVGDDSEGGTPGIPGVDYPVLTTIPKTSFSCKTQRYKGFFGDPETRCQVWHYCDLNGGQASFLCPNGTIFSQAGLTCDWWFNVRCSSTTQLYVLNESLYKFILPHTPKFPEDYSGPLVDKYLTLKFKEMEEEFKKNKNKQSTTEKGEEEEESEDTTEKDAEVSVSSDLDGVSENSQTEISTVSEANVVVETPGTSGNVERLSE